MFVPLEVVRYGSTGLLPVPVDITIVRFRSVGVDAVDRQPVVLQHVLVLLPRHLDDCVERHLGVGDILQIRLQEVGKDAPQGGLGNLIT